MVSECNNYNVCYISECDNDICYWLSYDTQTHTLANQSCVAEGGVLACPETEEKWLNLLDSVEEYVDSFFNSVTTGQYHFNLVTTEQYHRKMCKEYEVNTY